MGSVHHPIVNEQGRVLLWVEGSLSLTEADLAKADFDLRKAAQDALGKAGFTVSDVEEE